MTVAIIGTGYVGLVSGAGFAEKGLTVTCVDIDDKKVGLINKGKAPIFEEGLDGILKKRIGRNLTATTDLKRAIISSDASFICVGTPSREDGSADLKYIKDVAGSIGEALKEKEDYHVVVVKSTVIPGTTENVIIPIIEKNSGGKKRGNDFGVAMNPEFLREGIAVKDFLCPDRIIIGELDKKSGDLIENLYGNFNAPILRTGLKTAEMIKYASNSFLATKISFINEIGNICKELGIDTYDVAKGVSLDHRISPSFLRAGLGWGGSCFPKDVNALIHEAEKIGYDSKLLKSAVEVNKKQPERFINIAKKKIRGDFSGKTVAILGLAFKKGTDDVRDSQSISIIDLLLKENVSRIQAYDPEAEESMKKIFPNSKIKYADSVEGALTGTDIALILTGWKEFANLDYGVMKEKIVVDGRNVVKNKDGIDYEGLSW